MKLKLFEMIYNLTQKQDTRERALMALIDSNQETLPKGMRIEVIVKEYKGIREEPHFHLFPANHIPKKGKANDYDLITKVAITEIPPDKPSKVRAIAGNKPVPKEYQEAIFNWANTDDEKMKANNWEVVKYFWEIQTVSFS